MYTKPMSQLLYNRDNGGIYYGSGVALYNITSQASFTARGGNQNNLTFVSSDFISSFTIRSAVLSNSYFYIILDRVLFN
jgi:hypothetical protein